MPKTTKKEYKIPSGETKEEVHNLLLNYFDSIVELDNESKMILPNLKATEIITDYVQLNKDVANAPTTAGIVFWDDNAKTIAVELEPSNGGEVKLQIGQEMHIRAINKTGTTISNGEVVYISGAQGNRPTIDLADSGNYTNATRVIGVATEEIGNNLYGYVTTEGIVRDLDTSAYTEGDCVFVGTVSGSFSTITPADGDARVKIGTIIKSHITDGWLKVRINEDKYMFGDVDGGNYSLFESDGTLKFIGNGTVWKDENAGGVSLAKAAGNQPDLVTINGTNIITYAFDGGASLEELHWGNEIQHDYKEGTDLWPHMHFYPTTDAVGDIKFTLEYYIKSKGVTPVQGTTSLVTSSGGVAWEEIRINFDDVIDGTNLTIADQAHFRIFRDPTDAQDGYTNDVAIATVGYHYEVDTVGSRGIVSK